MEIVLGVCLLLPEIGVLVASDLVDEAAGVLSMSLLLAELDSWGVLYLSSDLLGVALDKDANLPAAATLGEPYFVEDIWEKSIFWVGVPSVEDFFELIPFFLGDFLVEDSLGDKGTSWGDDRSRQKLFRLKDIAFGPDLQYRLLHGGVHRRLGKSLPCPLGGRLDCVSHIGERVIGEWANLGESDQGKL